MVHLVNGVWLLSVLSCLNDLTHLTYYLVTVRWLDHVLHLFGHHLKLLQVLIHLKKLVLVCRLQRLQVVLTLMQNLFDLVLLLYVQT